MTRNRWASTRHRRNVCLRRFSIHMCDLDLWPHDLENLISWSPKCSMYSCKFCSNDDSIGSRRELSSSRDYHNAWSWPLTSWSENLFRAVPSHMTNICAEFHWKRPAIAAHETTDGRPNNLKTLCSPPTVVGGGTKTRLYCPAVAGQFDTSGSVCLSPMATVPYNHIIP